jgi:hypothetical protein
LSAARGHSNQNDICKKGTADIKARIVAGRGHLPFVAFDEWPWPVPKMVDVCWKEAEASQINSLEVVEFRNGSTASF